MNRWQIPRSLLFVPGDSERKQVKALASAADALILDLEDSVAPTLLSRARAQVGEFLRAHCDHCKCQLWVRVNPLAGGKLLDDLLAIVGTGPAGILLPKVSSPAETIAVDHYLTALKPAKAGRRARPGSWS